MAKRAVLVGINKYAQPGADLRGCVNDVRSMRAVLTELYGFADDDVTVLLDEQATTSAMQEAISRLVDSGKPGDVLVLHYSGHGSHVRDTSGDEKDLRDEILCPHDLSWEAPLLDDWLRTTFDRLADGVNLTVVMDCCHSGSNTRDVEPPDAERIPRYLPNPNLVADGRDLDGWDDGSSAVTNRRALRRDRDRGRDQDKSNGDVDLVDIVEVLVTGCRDTQTSADARIDGDYHGALTYYLVTAIRELGPDASYRQVHGRTLELLRGDYDQVPQLEGRVAHLDRPFLSAPAVLSVRA